MPFLTNFTHKKNKLLADLSTFGIGGPARYFSRASTIEELAAMLAEAYDAKIPVLILGKGSNSLFDDKGFDGLVILNRIEHLKEEGRCITVGSGYSFPRLGAKTARAGLGGLEFAAGIPASVGGAIYMNAGASGKETADCLVAVGYLSEKGEYRRFSKNELTFGYRTSQFQTMGGAIVEGVFELTHAPLAKEWQNEIIEYRLKTQPYKMKSAGCVFRNPKGESAGRVIEECGLKGLRVGGVCVSQLHANFIVNDQNGCAADVLELIETIKRHVLEEKGISLEVEIRYIPSYVPR